MTAAAGREPYTPADLFRFLQSEIGVTNRRRQAGSHSILELGDGRLVPFNDQMITSRLARLVAGRLGMTYPEFREKIGHPVTAGSGKVRKGPAKAPAMARVGRSDALRLIAEVRGALDDVETAVRRGQRDAVFYQRVCGSLVAAKNEVGAA